MKQTYVSYIENADGRMVDFNRWTLKRPETIAKKYTEALARDASFWRKIWRDGVTLAIYATPDGYNKEQTPAYIIPLDALTAE